MQKSSLSQILLIASLALLSLSCGSKNAETSETAEVVEATDTLPEASIQSEAPIQAEASIPSETIPAVEPQDTTNVTVEDRDGLRIYLPNYTRIDHVCETMPSPDDPSVIMCCEASFTGQMLKDFKHSNIAGDHVSGGVLYKGYKVGANAGCFAYYGDDGTWDFTMGDFTPLLDKAVATKGAAFVQMMLILNGEVKHKSNAQNNWRALCELDGRLCIIDNPAKMTFNQFINKLVSIGVTNAIYLDMGKGWNYSYYRDNSGQIKYIHNEKIPYTTNWITFYK